MDAPVSVNSATAGESDRRRGDEPRRRVGWLRAPGNRGRQEGSEGQPVQLAWESGAPIDDTINWAEATDGPGLLFRTRLKPLFEEHDLTGAVFRSATVHWASGSSDGYQLMEVVPATDDLIDVGRSTFMLENPYLGVVEGRAHPTTASELTARVMTLAAHPEMAGWKITPTQVHLRRPTDLFRLPTDSRPVLSADLVAALNRDGVGGLDVRPSTFSVTIGPDW